MIGREKETRRLNDLYNSSNAELVAVYGRRRVGKTYLINETFKDKMVFHHAGLSPAELDKQNGRSPLKKQLRHFYNSLILQGMQRSKAPENWLDAFLMLEMFLESKDNGMKQVVFLDEISWMDTPKSGFLTAFEGFWNTWGCNRNNLKVIVCGSATSWISDNLINNYGGLYNRVTCEIKLEPFRLKECEKFYQSKGVRMSRYDITQAYMITGGIPYYLNYYQKGMSLAQNVDSMFFAPNAVLKNEYDRLFNSIFVNSEMMKQIVDSLNKRNRGLTRSKISEMTGISKGGTLSDALKTLEVSDFIIRYEPFGISKREEYYKLMDPFCIFYNKFVKGKTSLDQSFWQQNVVSQSVVSWRGIAFENVCLIHIPQIKEALGISGVSTKQSIWSKKKDDTEGTQIDLIIERKDNVINMCEMKFYTNEFSTDKNYYQTITMRKGMIEELVPRYMVVHSTLVTTYGLKYNEYSGAFDNCITLDDLFR